MADETRADDTRILSREAFEASTGRMVDADRHSDKLFHAFRTCDHDAAIRELLAAKDEEIRRLREALTGLVPRFVEHRTDWSPYETCVDWCPACRIESALQPAAPHGKDGNGDQLRDATKVIQTAAPQLGMRMSDVRAGMRLRSVLEVDHGTVRDFITVTSITERGFQYSMDADMPLGPRYGVMLKDGNEHFGLNGFSLYEIAPAAPQLSGEAEEKPPDIYACNSVTCGLIGKHTDACIARHRAAEPTTEKQG